MSTPKSSVFYGLLIGFSCLVIGMIIAARLDLTPSSLARNTSLVIPVTNSAPLDGSLDAGTFRRIAQEAGPSVVTITTTSMQAVEPGIQDFFENFPLPGGGQRRGQAPAEPQRVRGAGSGFIIDKAGFILTNNHVIDGATDIRIRLASMRDGEEGLPAKVIGGDELTDTALLQLTELPREGLSVSKFGDSAQMAPGDWVMAIGNPFNLSNTVTVGIVSAVARPTPVAPQRSLDFIQTDAAINSGNSGGPLLNIRGEVIGINSMTLTSGSSNPRLGGTGGNLGVGFAVPINTVRDLLPQLREGKVTRGRIGVEVLRNPMTEEYARDLGLQSPQGAEVSSVEDGGPAGEGGVRAGDVIIEFNGKPVRDNSELVSLVTSTKPGTIAPVKVVRERKTLSLNVAVGELDLAQEQQVSAEGPRALRPEARDTALGMTLQPLSPAFQRQNQVPAGRGGAIVVEVTPFGPAADADIRPGDVILSLQGTPIRNADQAVEALAAVETGRTARVIVWRFSSGQGQERLLLLRKR